MIMRTFESQEENTLDEMGKKKIITKLIAKKSIKTWNLCEGDGYPTKS